MTTLPPEVAQACALLVAAESTADALLEAMGIYDPDDDEAEEPAGRSAKPGQAANHRKAGTHPSEDDAQRSTGIGPAGEHPSTTKRETRSVDLMVRKARDVLLTIKSERKHI